MGLRTFLANPKASRRIGKLKKQIVERKKDVAVLQKFQAGKKITGEKYRLTRVLTEQGTVIKRNKFGQVVR